jgi:hypothetical protein
MICSFALDALELDVSCLAKWAVSSQTVEAGWDLAMTAFDHDQMQHQPIRFDRMPGETQGSGWGRLSIERKDILAVNLQHMYNADVRAFRWQSYESVRGHLRCYHVIKILCPFHLAVSYRGHRLR